MANQTLSVIPLIIDQHVEEAAFLWLQRNNAVDEPHYDLKDLVKLDDRVAAHLDGLAVAGDYGLSVCETALGDAGAGELFAVAVQVIERKDEKQLDKLFALAEALPEVRHGLISAFGWVSAHYLAGTGAKLLASTESFKQLVGVAACAMHRVDPAAVLTQLLSNPDPVLRSRAFHAAGELGRTDLIAACIYGLQDKDVASRFYAAWSAVLLGDRQKALKALQSFVHLPSDYQKSALQLLLKVLDLPDAQQLLKTIAQNPANKRVLIQSAGIVGDAQYLPWLIRQMGDDKFARVAGESFSLMTGLDLAYLDLERDAPENFESGPTENPEDEDVAMDQDENLPWPDAIKLNQWWLENNQYYQAGVRYFMGVGVAWSHCVQILGEGYQRQRVHAAQHLCLLKPGTQLFPTNAPGWRQRRWLVRMG